MAFFKRIESNTNYAGAGYMPEYSNTIKSLPINNNGTEVFDLGDDWRLIDNIVVSIVNGVDSTGSAVTCNFAENPVLLLGVGAFQVNTLCGVGVGQTVRFSSGSGLSTVSANIRVTGRFFRLRIQNGTSSAQGNNTYIDLRAYSLTP